MGPWTRASRAVFWTGSPFPKSSAGSTSGCGTGVFTELILEKAAPSEIVAIDPPRHKFFMRAKSRSRRERISASADAGKPAF